MAKVRTRTNPPVMGTSSQFNTHGMGEVIVHFDAGDADSMLMGELEVLVGVSCEWVPMDQAFRNRRLIPDNYNRAFREPRTASEQLRGWYD